MVAYTKIMTTVSQKNLFFSSRFGSGTLRSGSRGIPLRLKARPSPSRELPRSARALTDMALRIGGKAPRPTCERESPLSEPGNEGFNLAEELTRTLLVAAMVAVHGGESRMGDAPAQLFHAVL